MKYIAFLLLFFVTACTVQQKTDANPAADAQEILFFPETGHSVQPPFSSFFQRPGQLDLLGYPITEAMTDMGWTVQYFQFGRLEFHPENPTDYSITVGWLGQLSQRVRPPVASPHPQNGLYFPKTGHNISAAFLEFFLQNGGTVQFGMPISEPFIERGYVVQDFQSVRMIWDAGNIDVPVKLEPLGENYFLQNEPLSQLQPVPKPENAVIGARATLDMLPAGATIHAKVEQIPDQEFSRVIVSAIDGAQRPLVGYAPQLHIGGEVYPFPPTLKSGQTQMLVATTGITSSTGTIFSPDGKRQLASVTLFHP